MGKDHARQRQSAYSAAAWSADTRLGAGMKDERREGIGGRR